MSKNNILRKIIEKYYGEPAVKRINKRLVEKYGIPFDVASENEDLSKLKDILQEEFNQGYDLIIGEYLKKQPQFKANKIILYKNHPITDFMIRYLGDMNSIKILTIASKFVTAYEICSLTNITLSTVYRKIDELTSIGLLFKEETIQNDHGKRQGKYIKTFDKIIIEHTGMFSRIIIFTKPDIENHLKKIIMCFFNVKK